MSDELTDADLDRLARQAEYAPDCEGFTRLVAAYRALRARRAQDTPSDPAAWLISDQRGPHSDSRPWATANAQEAERHRSHGCTVTPLRAPGAVAAAPTEDALERATQDVRDGLHCDLAAMQTPQQQDMAVAATLERLEQGWRLAPPAPSAEEDEAAVVRAALDGHAVRWNSDGDHGQHVWLECAGCDWEADTSTPEDRHYADLAVAALAAARGPRTQEDT